MNAGCGRAAELWLEAADADLNQEQTEWLAAHLQQCGACREAHQQFLRTDGDLIAYGAWCDKQGVRPRAKRPATQWVPAAVAAMAAAVLLGVVLMRPVPPPASPSEAVDAERFVPVPYVLPLQPDENARVMRMEVPVAALMSAGYRVGLADPAAVVPAEVLVGEDGLVHAVRLLSKVTLN